MRNSSNSHRQAADVKLSDMVAAAVLKVGDVISYKRYFSGLDVVVEKDAVVGVIYYTVTFLD